MYIYILHIKFSVNGEVMGESVQSIANNTKTRTHNFIMHILWYFYM